MTEATRLDVILLAAGATTSAIIWMLTWKRYRGFQYDLLRLALTAVLTGHVVLSWIDGIDVYALTGLMLHGNDLPLSLTSVFMHWFLVIGVLFFSGKGLIFFACESRWAATRRWVGGGSCAPCRALIAAVLVVPGLLYSAYPFFKHHQMQKQREEQTAEMIKRSLRHAPEAIACVTSASEAHDSRKTAVPARARCGGRSTIGMAPQPASVGTPVQASPGKDANTSFTGRLSTDSGTSDGEPSDNTESDPYGEGQR